MSTVMEFMAEDHDRLDGIFKEFSEARHADPRKAKSLFGDFRTDLKRHIRWEEDILFPLFEAKTGMGDGGPVAVMKIEHREIEKLLDEVSRRLEASAAAEAPAQRLVEILGEHNYKEESILYPWIDHSLNSQERTAVLAKLRNGK